MSTVFTNRVIELTNNERTSRGLAPLAFNNQLATAAQQHSQNMAVQDFFSHTGRDGSSVGTRTSSTGYQWTRVAENIAAGQDTPEEVVAAWLNSPGHRANILNPNLREIGVGYSFLANDTGSVNFNHYWTQVFATSTSSPSPSPTPTPQPTPEIAVLLGSTTIADGTTTPIDFGTSTQGNPIVRTFSVQNIGNGPLNVSAIQIPQGFSVVGTFPSSIPANSAADLQIQWNGNASAEGEIRLTNNDSNENPFNFFVRGTVTVPVVPEIEVFLGSTTITDGTTTPIDFGTSLQGNPIVRTFSVRNTGSGALNISDIQVPNNFTVIGTFPNLIPANSSADLQIQWNGNASAEGEIRLTNNDSNENPFNFFVRGTVTVPVVPEIEVLLGTTTITDGTTTPIDFGTSTQGNPIVRTFSVRNIGNGPLNVSAIQVPQGFSVVGNFPTAISANSTADLLIQWNGNVSATGEIQLTTNDSNENPFNFFVTATATTTEPDRLFIQRPLPLNHGDISPQPNSSVLGTRGNDLLLGTAQADDIRGMDGDDRVWGSDGNDDLNGNVGNDVVDGQGDSDIYVRGGQGNDTVFGGSGDDLHVNGNKGNDFVLGGSGNDTLFGGQDDDTLFGEAGADVLFGNVGRDVFVLEPGSSTDVIADFAIGQDLIGLLGMRFSEVSITPSGNNTVLRFGDQTLAEVIGVQAAQLGLGSFVLI